MSELFEKVSGFLAADGFEVELVENKFIVAKHSNRKNSDGQQIITALIVIDNATLAADTELRSKFFAHCKTLLNPTTQLEIRVIRQKGLPLTGFREAAVEAGLAKDKGEVTIQAPVQFFDTAHIQVAQSNLVGEGGGDKLGRWIRGEFGTSETSQRVPQKYFSRNPANWTGQGELAAEDLLTQLKHDIQSNADEPVLRLVVGAAGMGKSVLFNNLLRELYGDFQDAKRRHEDDVPRPIPFLPKPIWEARRGGAKISTISDVVTAVRNTPGATPTSNGELFDWLLENGYTTWLFDGLDEFYGSDDTFLPFLFERIKDNSNAKIIVFMRDSLLSSSVLLSNYLANITDEQLSYLKIYQLAPWSDQEQQTLMQQRLTEGSYDANYPSAFVESLKSGPELQDIATLPYYCNLLADRFIENKGQLSDTSEFDLLNDTLLSLLKREEDKLIPASDIYRDWKIYHNRDRLLDLLSYVGHKFCTEQFRANEINNEYKGITQEELASIIEDDDFHESCTDDEKQAGRLALIQFALFSAGGDHGYISFSHEIMAEYLAARWAIGIAKNGPGLLPDAVGKFFFSADTLLCRFLASELSQQPDSLQHFIDAMKFDMMKVWHRRNMIQILCMAHPERNFLANDATILKERDLTGVQFRNLDLSGASFEDADLTNVVFDQCNLRNVDFTDAKFRGTQFINIQSGALEGADFTDMDRFQNLVSGNKTISTESDLNAWCAEHKAKR